MAKFLALCLKPRTIDDDTESTQRSTTDGVQDACQSSTTSAQEGRRVAYVELLRRSGEPLGLVVEGGADQGQTAHITHLRPGGVAEKCLALQTGDQILSINGTSTEHLMQAEITALLDNTRNVVNLEVAYEAADEEEEEGGSLKKTAQISVTREGNGFGFTVSGGRTENRPITVSHVAEGSTAFRRGILKAGDRVVKINDTDVTQVTQQDAVTLLQSSDDTCLLEIEYDVTVHDKLLESRGPLQVDLIKPKGASLGISLSGALYLGQPMYISKIKEAGIAERCGALHVRDQLVSVNGVTLENKSIRDAVRLLAKSDFNVRLEIIPAHNLTIVPNLSDVEALSDTLSRLSDTHHPGRQSQLSLASGGNSSHPMLCHPETMKVRLKADDIGFGMSLHGGVSGRKYRPVKIAVIEDGGPAALAGVLQVGDRIISLNGINVDGVATAHQALKLVQEGGDQLDMEAVFDVMDAVVPTSGTFEVKMVKTPSLNLGITINGSDKREDNIWISSIKKGGIACRMGTLKPGDVILAINAQSLEQCNLREAAHALRNAGDVVTLTISKENCDKPTTGLTPSDAVIFSVELHADGCPLGVSLTGSNHQPQPIFIARISEGGVADRTGALKVGDRVMAINGQSLFGKTLRDAIFMLQIAGDTVTLKISKLNRRKHSRHKAYSPTNKSYHRYHGDHRRYHGGHVSPPRRHGYHGRLSRHGRQLSSTTIASSVSGAATPENPEYRVPYLPATAPSSRAFSRDFERRYHGFVPSDHSAFSRLPALEDGEEEESERAVGSSRQKLYGAISDGGGYSPAGLHYPVAARLSPVELLQAQQRSLLERSSLAETDEETEVMKRLHPRRASLPVHPMTHGSRHGSSHWDFKQRAMPFPNLPVGRVSPLTSDHEHGREGGGGATVTKFLKQNSHTELGSVVNRAASRTPPDKAASVVEELSSENPVKLESPEPREEEKEEEEEERGEELGGEEEEEEERGEELGGGEEGSESEEEEEESELGDEVTEVQWDEVDVDNENGAKAVHMDDARSHQFTAHPTFQTPPSSSAAVSASTPNSLTRPTKHVPSQGKKRTPSVPALPTTLAVPSSDSGISSFPECLDEYRLTLHNSRNYMKEFKALAESGSSDPESDPEPTLASKLRAAQMMEEITNAAKLPTLMDYHTVTLTKESVHTDLGFSLSDGLGEPGVYVKSIHSGGLAEQDGDLRVFDRIMKINDIVVRDYDCCRVVPLLQELKDDITLLVTRNTLSKRQHRV